MFLFVIENIANLTMTMSMTYFVPARIIIFILQCTNYLCNVYFILPDTECQSGLDTLFSFCLEAFVAAINLEIATLEGNASGRSN